MTNRKEITFLIKVMNGGGAERVVSLLSQAMVQQGYDVNLILTHQKKEDASLQEIGNEINVISLDDELLIKQKHTIVSNLMMLYARIGGKIIRKLYKRESDISTIYKYYSRNYEKINWIRKWFCKHRNTVVIAFMYDSIFMTLLARNSNNRVIISERGDPSQYIKSNVVETFIRTQFKKADHVVFQSPDVREWYLNNYNIDGTIIYNSIKNNLPEKCDRERKKYIVNFCRISPEKNLHLLIDAFEMFQQKYSEYELVIFGNSSDLLSGEYEKEIREKINTSKCKEKMHLYEARKDIHTVIKDYAMYVSSSDHEGMSNSMLEAMAMGLPVICTDCPAGGARAIIQHEKNGLLVPVRDPKRMCLAMMQIAENPDFAEKLSRNAYMLREVLSVENIIKEWERILVK